MRLSICAEVGSFFLRRARAGSDCQISFKSETINWIVRWNPRGLDISRLGREEVLRPIKVFTRKPMRCAPELL